MSTEKCTYPDRVRRVLEVRGVSGCYRFTWFSEFSENVEP
jgi:hypothetical protein